LVVVKGDVTLKNLGLTCEDRSLIKKKVSVIFHCAANVRFDQKLKNAVTYNTLGTQRVLELAEDIDNLDVSTGAQEYRYPEWRRHIHLELDGFEHRSFHIRSFSNRGPH
jgi:nucleoside-diphosphate-sugar epimerase